MLHGKILHNTYPTNILHRIGTSENRNCKFCTDEIEHFFWFCAKINFFWKKVEEYAYLKFDKLIRIK